MLCSIFQATRKLTNYSPRTPSPSSSGWCSTSRSRSSGPLAHPRDLKERLGGKLDAGEIASMEPAKLAAIFSERPALHRFPASNSERVQQLSRIIVQDYGGEAARVWEGAPSGAELLRRVKALPGFGEQKAKIFVALLGKQLGVRPPGWQEVSQPFGDPGTTFSVADITDAGSLVRVRAYKSQAKAAAKAAKASAAT